jgi:hypothetical protein
MAHIDLFEFHKRSQGHTHEWIELCSKPPGVGGAAKLLSLEDLAVTMSKFQEVQHHLMDVHAIRLVPCFIP